MTRPKGNRSLAYNPPTKVAGVALVCRSLQRYLFHRLPTNNANSLGVFTWKRPVITGSASRIVEGSTIGAISASTIAGPRNRIRMGIGRIRPRISIFSSNESRARPARMFAIQRELGKNFIHAPLERCSLINAIIARNRSAERATKRPELFINAQFAYPRTNASVIRSTSGERRRR